MNTHENAWAVIRQDSYNPDAVVVSVVPTREEAEFEVERLNEINGDNRCRYYLCYTRWYPESKRVEW